jgi:predicted nucleic acid-binding protein
LRGQFITQTEYQSLRTKLATDTQQQYQLISLASQHVDEAIELTARHKLRGYDAVHLACALYLNRLLLDSNLPPLTFIASDQDLLQAAQAEGLAVDDPSDYP